MSRQREAYCWWAAALGLAPDSIQTSQAPGGLHPRCSGWHGSVAERMGAATGAERLISSKHSSHDWDGDRGPTWWGTPRPHRQHNAGPAIPHSEPQFPLL